MPLLSLSLSTHHSASQFGRYIKGCLLGFSDVLNIGFHSNSLAIDHMLSNYGFFHPKLLYSDPSRFEIRDRPHNTRSAVNVR
jgi:hypothetical protein